MRYINGNYVVRIYGDSTLDRFRIEKTALRTDEEFCPAFPDSIDLKISNKCKWGCKFCHENSVPCGKIFDIEKTKAILSQLPPKTPIELAIGGGNLMESIDEISPFVDWARDYGFLVRGTINHKDLDNELSKKEIDFLKKFGGIGISIDRIPEDKFIQMVSFEIENRGMMKYVNNSKIRINQYLFPCGRNLFSDLDLTGFPEAVFHIIAGVFPPEQFNALTKTGIPVLVLGYKQWGRAKSDPLPDMTGIKEEIKEFFYKRKMSSGYFEDSEISTLCFDGLAVEQLGIKEMMDDPALWRKVYMGDEGTCSMYIDAVEGMYAKTSRSEERRSWNEVGLLDFFKDDSISV